MKPHFAAMLSLLDSGGAAMNLGGLFGDSDDSDAKSYSSGASDKSDGDEWLHPTGKAPKQPKSKGKKEPPADRGPLYGKRKEPKHGKKGKKGKISGSGAETGGDRDGHGGRAVEEPSGRHSVLSSAVSSAVGGLPAPLLFLRHRSLSFSGRGPGERLKTVATRRELQRWSIFVAFTVLQQQRASTEAIVKPQSARTMRERGREPGAV